MKKIAVETMRKYMKAKMPESTVIEQKYPFGDSEIVVHIKTKLTTAEVGVFVRRILSACFDKDGNYRPEYYQPVFKATVIQICTDLPVLSLRNERGDDGESLMDIDAMADMYDTLRFDDLSDGRYQALTAYLNEVCDSAVVDYANRHTTSSELMRKIDEIVDEAKVVLGKVASIDTDSLMKYAQVLSEATSETNIVEAILKHQDASGS